jgi:hypothetical protein
VTIICQGGIHGMGMVMGIYAYDGSTSAWGGVGVARDTNSCVGATGGPGRHESKLCTLQIRTSL